MLKKVLLVVVLVVAGFLVFAATRPDKYHVQRSTEIAAPSPVIFAQLADFKAWPAWSPWEKRDPQMTKTFAGPPSAVGSTYTWQGNKEVGSGKMTIVVSEPPEHIRYKLEFIEPFAAVSDTGFTLASAGRNTTVTWAMDGNNTFTGKIFSVFMNMDKMIGGDFEAGLAALKSVSEAEASARAATEAQAAAASAAAEAARNAAGAQGGASGTSAPATAKTPAARKK